MADTNPVVPISTDPPEDDDEYPPCDICGKPCGNIQGRHYECAVMSGEDLDRTMGFGELAHIW